MRNILFLICVLGIPCASWAQTNLVAKGLSYQFLDKRVSRKLRSGAPKLCVLDTPKSSVLKTVPSMAYVPRLRRDFRHSEIQALLSLRYPSLINPQHCDRAKATFHGNLPSQDRPSKHPPSHLEACFSSS